MRAAALALLLAGCASVPPAPPPLNPAAYRCQGNWLTGDDRFAADAVLTGDGHLQNWQLSWQRHSPDVSLAGWGAYFYYEGPGLPAPADDWNLHLRLDGFAPGSRTVRVDLLRGEGGTEVVALSAPRTRADPLIDTIWRRDAVRAALAGAPELIVRVTDRHGRVRLSHRISAALLDGPATAVAAHRAELEAMVADYRTRCEFVPANSDIVVT
jgi:hypothetical protein